MERWPVVVIGGGAAGIFAAWRAATLGARTLLLEKTPRLGTKILISGGGKCNVAHDGPLEDVIRAFRRNETLFLRPSCYRMPNRRIVEIMTSRGLDVYTRPDGRVFPVDQTAKDVVAILEGYVREAGVAVRTQSPVVGLRPESDGVRVQVGEPIPPNSGYRHAARGAISEIHADRVILCTGGASYPNCGTTGDGWDWLRDLGHTVVPPRAALAPIYLRFAQERAGWSGVALRDVVLKTRADGRELARWRGDTLFTHQGVSGPCALGVSRAVAEHSDETRAELSLDVRPDEPSEALASQIAAWPARKSLGNLVAELVPERLADAVLGAARLDPALPAGKLDRKGRNRLAETLKAWPLGPVRIVPLEKGEVTAGGVTLDEVDPKTMRSLRVPHLYLAGEVLDVAGPVGGYNLQAAFATGYAAGEEAARSLG